MSRVNQLLVWVWASWGAPASAQAQDAPRADPPPSDPPPIVLTLPTPPVALVPPPAVATYREGYRWASAGAPGADDLASVTISPEGARQAAFVTRSGAVWWSEDGARSWRMVLRGFDSSLGDDSVDEAALLDVETRLGEILDSLDLDEGGIVDDDALEAFEDEQDDAAGNAVDAAVEELQGDALQRGWFAEVAGAQGDLATSLPRVWLDSDGVLFVGRPDGLYLSQDGAATFRRVLDQGVTAVAPLPGGGWVAGGFDGVFRSTDLQQWRPAGVAVDVVRDLAPGVDGLVAATDDGLWTSSDGDQWRRLGGSRASFRVVARAPDSALVVLAADEDTVYRVEEDGDSVLAPVGPALRGIRAITLTPGGLVLAAGEEGAWESRDGGGSYVPLRRGLSDASARGIAVGGALVLLATDEGLYRLVEVDEDVRFDAPVEEGLPPLALLLESAARRVGGDTGRFRLGTAGQLLAWALPQVGVEFRWHRDDTTSSALDAGQTRRASGDSGLYAFLTWRPPSRNVGVGDPQQVVVQEGVDGPQFYSGGFDQWMMLGSVQRRATDDRMKTTTRITELTFNWDLLMREQREATGSVEEAVHLWLRILEIEAWLDALTDGAVTRYRAARSAAGGG